MTAGGAEASGVQEKVVSVEVAGKTRGSGTALDGVQHGVAGKESLANIQGCTWS